MEHNMLRELREGPEAIRRTLEGCAEEVRAAAAALTGSGFIIGSGTSYHAGLIFQYFLLKYAGRGYVTVPASEFNEWGPFGSPGSLVGFSQSGESSDILAAFRGFGGRVKIGITNTPGSTLTKLSDYSIVTRAGEERAVVATKTFDAQIAVSMMLAMVAGGRDTSPLRDVPSKVEGVLALEDRVRRLAERYRDVERSFVLGRGAHYAVALEAALKLKEAAMIHAEGFAVREFLHGPVQLVDESTLVVALVPTDHALRESEKALAKIRGYGAPILAITTEGVEGVDRHATDMLELPATEGDLSVFTFTKAIQMLAYHLAVLRGLDPDRPTKLTKVVRYEATA